MNGTMFFDTISTHPPCPVYDSTENDSPQIELNQNLLSLPINLLSSSYLNDNSEKDRSEKPDSMKGLYKPISPKDYTGDDGYFHQCFTVTSSDQGANFDVQNGFSQLNQAIMFSKISHLSPDVTVYDNHIDYHQAMQYQPNHKTFRNNYNRNFNKFRSNTANLQSNNSNKSANHRKRHQSNSPNWNGTDLMIRRAHGLSHRFKSKSEVMKIDPNPERLLSGSPLDELNREMWDVFIDKAQKIETYENKILLWKNLFLYIRKCVSHYSLYIVGSTMTGFGLDTSDVDMCLLIRPCMENVRLDSLQHLNNIRHHLIKSGLTVDPELILAKVPILKFRDESTGFEIDLNCNNSVGIHNTHLLYCYSRLDWRIRPLVVVIKLWARANGINDAKNLTVSSYSWTLMMIHYLQCGVSPPVLPCLHTLYPERFNSDKNRIPDVHEDFNCFEEFRSQNCFCLADLLLGFFEYYSNFDFAQYAISVRAGCRLPVDDCKNNKAPKNDVHQWKYMCIEEPFDFSNTARSVYDIAAFRHIRNVITRSFEELIATKSLNGIMPVQVLDEATR